LLSKHQLRILKRSWFISETALCWCCRGNDIRSFVSST
jgi:hypothetical protein